MELNSYAPSCTVNVAVCPHLGFKKNGELQHPWTGHPLKVKSLKETVYSQLDIPESQEKGTSGCVFPFAYDVMYAINDESIDFHSSGVVFQDLDHIPANELKQIHDNFDLLTKYLPDLVCLHYSASGGGLHLYYLSPKLAPDDYLKRLIVNTIRLDKVCNKFLGISIPSNIYDEHQLSIKQRFFLNRPKDMKILWNDNAYSTIFPVEQENKLIDKEVDKYPPLADKWNKLKYEPTISQLKGEQFKSESYDITRKNKRVEHLDYHDRWMLYNSLRVMFNNNKDLITREWEWCMNNMIYTDENNTQLKTALKEPRTKRWDTTVAHMAWTIVLKFYNITPLKDTKCEDKEYTIEQDKEPALTQEEKLLLAKYM